MRRRPFSTEIVQVRVLASSGSCRPQESHVVSVLTRSGYARRPPGSGRARSRVRRRRTRLLHSAHLDRAIANYHADIRSGFRRIDEHHAERVKRMHRRLSAARSERDAAEIKYKAFLDSPMEAEASWLFWLISAVCVAVAICLPRMARTYTDCGTVQ